MKRIRALFFAPLVLGLFLTGCASLPVDQTFIDSSTVILRSAARDGAIAAMTPPSGNTNNAIYFRLAADALSGFVTAKDYTPGALQTALLNLNVPELNDPYVRIGVGTVIDLYQLYYGLYVKPNVVSNAPVAIGFLVAIQDGFNQALGRPVSPVLAAFRRGAAPGPAVGGAVLPRPLTPVRPSRK